MDLKTFTSRFIKYLKAKQFKTCKVCPLYENPSVSFETINVPNEFKSVDIMIVGMNPYKDEIKQDRPFVGRAGKLLRKQLEKFDNYSIVITNVCMCYIPNNGDPSDEILARCKPLLEAQIQYFKPKIIVALGSIAASQFIPDAKNYPLKSFRKIPHQYKNSVLFVTYHPSACLRNSNLLKSFESDFDFIYKYLTSSKNLLDIIANLETLDNWQTVSQLLQSGFKLVDYQFFYDEHNFKHPLILGIFKNPQTNEYKIYNCNNLPVDYYICNKVINKAKLIGIEAFEKIDAPYMQKQTVSSYEYALILSKSINKTNAGYFFNADIPIVDRLVCETRKFSEDYGLSEYVVGYLDIEVLTDGTQPKFQDPKFPVNAFAFTTSKSNKIVLGFLKDKSHKTIDTEKIRKILESYKPIADKYEVPLDFELHIFETEKELLEFLQTLIYDIDILTSWNAWFDANYIYERSKLMNYNCTLSKLNIFGYRSKKTNLYKAPGIIIDDMLETYKASLMRERPSYKLDYIAQLELGAKKVEYEGNLQDLYLNEPEKFIAYNLIDTFLIRCIDKVKKLYMGNIQMKHFIGVSFENFSSAIAKTDAFMYYHLSKKNLAMRARITPPPRKYEGGFNREPKIGYFEWVIDLDASSMYPSIIQTFNISPETHVIQIVDQEIRLAFYNYMRAKIMGYKENIRLPKTIEVILKPSTFFGDSLGVKMTLPLSKLEELILKKRYIITPSGAIFKSKDEQVGIYVEILEYLLKLRKEHKKRYLQALEQNEDKQIIEYWNRMQKVPKIAANVFYGAQGNEYYRFYNPDAAEAITLTGQIMIKLVSANLNRYIEYLIKNPDKIKLREDK